MTPGKVYASIQIIQDGKVTNLKQFELIVQELAGQPVGIAEKAEYSALVAVLSDANKFRTDIDSLDTIKADKAAVDRTVSELTNKINNFTKGNPSGVYATLVALKTAYPNGNSNIYVVTADGKWYYWNGTDWVAGGVYQSQGIADKSIGTNETQEIVMNGVATFLSKDNITFDSATDILNVPAGGFRYGNKTVSFDAHEIDASSTSAHVDFLTVYFDTSLLKFIVLNNTMVQSAPSTAILQGVIAKSLNRWFGNNLPIIINGKRSKEFLPNDLQAILIGLDNDVDFDFANNQIIIPKITNIATPTKLFGSIDITGGSSDLILEMSSDSSEQVLLFNYKTSQLSIRPYTNFSSDILADEMLLAYFSRKYKKVVANFKYKVNGVLTYDKPLFSPAYLLGISDDIDFNFSERKIKIPALTNLWIGNEYFTSGDLTGRADLEVDMPELPFSEIALIFDKENKTFFAKSTSEIKELVAEQTICAVFSVNNEKVAAPFKYKINGLKTDDESGFKNTIFDSEIERVNEETMITKNPSNFVIDLITDSHGRDDHIMACVDTFNGGLADCLVHGGDINLAERGLSDVRKALNDSARVLLKANGPVFTIRGNHDADGTQTVSEMTDSEFFNRIIYNFRDSENFLNTQGTREKGYYFADFPNFKIRLVFTNSSEIKNGDLLRWGWSLEQLKWLAETALQVPDDSWSVLVFGHHNASQTFSNTIKGENGQKLLDILNAFKKKENYLIDGISANFTKGDLIAYWFGHTHCDALKMEEGLKFYQVSTASALPDYYKPENIPADNTSWERPSDTVAVNCFDRIIIDFNQKKVKTIRFGAGINREFNY
ncbi:MAG: metallophosphoesterase, partial [Bacilli bacterium]